MDGQHHSMDLYTLDKTVMYSEDRVKWRQLVNGVTKPWNKDGWRQGKPWHNQSLFINLC